MQHPAPEALNRSARGMIALLAGSVALTMTGHGLVVPVFAKRLGEIGQGVDALSWIFMAFALGQFLLAPLLGALADRIGRKPIIVLALAGVVGANLAYLLIDTTGAYIAVRFGHGAITAGLLPAALGIVADLVPERARARWLGIVMGSYAAGFVFGPSLGGVLYDTLGFIAPFAASALFGALALALTGVLLREPRTPAHQPHPIHARPQGLLAALPRPLHLLASLLLLDLVATFAFAFVEPQMVFYLYDVLGYSTTQFGLIVSVYGLAMVAGQAGLGRLSDRWGRRPVIALGFLLNATFFASLAIVSSFALTFVVAAIAGLGAAVIAPALSALYLDITGEAHRARVMGFKESAAALGYVVGPLLAAIIGDSIAPRTLFMATAILPIAAAVFVLSLRWARSQPATGSIQDRTTTPASTCAQSINQ
jgi:MFS family permease